MTEKDKTDLCKMAYTMGYKRFEHSLTEWKEILQESEIPSELWSNGNENHMPISDLACESRGKNSHQKMIWKVEEKLDFDPENEDWDNQGIYEIIEDCCISWESGAFHALMGKDFNPESLPFVE